MCQFQPISAACFRPLLPLAVPLRALGGMPAAERAPARGTWTWRLPLFRAGSQQAFRSRPQAFKLTASGGSSTAAYGWTTGPCARPCEGDLLSPLVPLPPGTPYEVQGADAVLSFKYGGRIGPAGVPLPFLL